MPSEKSGTHHPTELNEIAFSDIRFAYPRGQELFHGLTGGVRRGERLVITGRSGVGKTTLLKILLGLLEPQGGLLTVDGRPLPSLEKSAYRRRIGFVSQTATLFSDSLRYNVTLGNIAIQDQLVIKALSDAGLPLTAIGRDVTLDTMLGERGCNLSAGQRQRVILARALLREPDALLLDEATTSIDHETRMDILNRIMERFGDRIIIQVDHHLPAGGSWKLLELKCPFYTGS